MPNLLELLDSIAQIITSNKDGDVWFTSLDLIYAFDQIPLSDGVSSQCNSNIDHGEQTGTYRCKTGFYGLTDMHKEFQKAMDNTLQGLSEVFDFLDVILMVSKGLVLDHSFLVDKIIVRLEEEGFAHKLSKCKFSLNHLSWFGDGIDSEGYRPNRSKIDALLAIEQPKIVEATSVFHGHSQSFAAIFAEPLGPFGKIPLITASLKASNKNKLEWG